MYGRLQAQLEEDGGGSINRDGWIQVVCGLRSQGQHCPKIMKPPQSLPLQMAERLLCAQPDSVANH